MLKAGRRDEATAHVWNVFERAPSLELYARLRERGGGIATRRAMEFLQARLAAPTAAGWGHPADLLISILMQESLSDAARAAVRSRR